MQKSKLFNPREDNRADEYVNENADTHIKVQASENTSTQLTTQECKQMNKLACNYACLRSDMQYATFLGCKNGLSFRQINLLSIIKNNPLPINYQQISKLLHWHFSIEASPDAVRGILQRLRRKNLIESKVFHSGFARGNLYSCSLKVCKDIPSFFELMSVQNVQTEAENFMQTNHSIDRIDRNINLSILNQTTAKIQLENFTDEDIALQWENLGKYGFGKSQIEQIIKNLEAQGSSLENVIQGLHHAEWDLEHKQMLDRNGELVKSPVNWVYRILAKQGYYPRPKNYVSPEEQVELDSKKSREALEKVQKENEEKEYSAWLSTLSDDDKERIISERKAQSNTNLTFPEPFLLRGYFKEQKNNFKQNE